jgi:hypothetical protein
VSLEKPSSCPIGCRAGFGTKHITRYADHGISSCGRCHHQSPQSPQHTTGLLRPYLHCCRVVIPYSFKPSTAGQKKMSVLFCPIFRFVHVPTLCLATEEM